jgi:hypothetical protein
VTEIVYVWEISHKYEPQKTYRIYLRVHWAVSVVDDQNNFSFSSIFYSKSRSTQKSNQRPKNRAPKKHQFWANKSSLKKSTFWIFSEILWFSCYDFQKDFILILSEPSVSENWENVQFCDFFFVEI